MTQDHIDVEMDNDTEQDADEEVVREKDDTEKKLERMLFGDDEGFQGALKSQQDRGLMAWGAMSDDESDGEGEEGEASDGEEKELGDVDDSDVCCLGPFFCDIWLMLDVSSSSSTPERAPSLPISPIPTHPTKKAKMKAYLRRGTTATTRTFPSLWRATSDCASCATPRLMM